MPLTVLMDLAELEDGCSWLLYTAALSLSAAFLFLALNLGTAVEGRPWQELLIAIIVLGSWSWSEPRLPVLEKRIVGVDVW